MDVYLKTLSNHLGDGDATQDGSNNLSDIPLSAYRRVVDGGEEVSSEQEKQEGDLQDVGESNEEDEELKNLQEDPEDDEEEEIEELDLTNQQGNFYTGDDVTPVMIVPSLDALGANSIGALMSHLIGSQPSLFHSQDDSSAEEEDAMMGDVVYGKKFDGSELDSSHDGHNLQKWEELFRLLEIQHQQQLLLQSEQHERRVSHLKCKILYLI